MQMLQQFGSRLVDWFYAVLNVVVDPLERYFDREEVRQMEQASDDAEDGDEAEIGGVGDRRVGDIG